MMDEGVEYDFCHVLWISLFMFFLKILLNGVLFCRLEKRLFLFQPQRPKGEKDFSC